MSASIHPDITGMAAFIGQQIHKSVSPDEEWGELTADERAQFTIIAHAAAGAHDAWRTLKGFRIIPPGAVVRPTSKEEAGAMLRACEEFFKKNPVLVMAPKKKLIRPGGVG